MRTILPMYPNLLLSGQSYQYNKDAYALDFLAKILADGKKAPLYKVLIKEKKLTSKATAFNYSKELAGELTIRDTLKKTLKTSKQ